MILKAQTSVIENIAICERNSMNVLCVPFLLFNAKSSHLVRRSHYLDSINSRINTRSEDYSQKRASKKQIYTSLFNPIYHL